jgi:hypothetical protein
MDAMAQQMAMEYAAYKNGYFPNSGMQMQMPGMMPSTVPGQQMQQYFPGMQEPTGYLTQAPPELPFRPAVIVDKEHLLNGGKGFAIATILYLTLRFKGLVLWAVIAITVLFCVYKAVEYREELIKWKQEDQLRVNGRLLPEAQKQPLYVIQHPF